MNDSARTVAKPDAVLTFWFETLSPADWWRKSKRLDDQIRQQFAATHAAACRGELHHWRSEPAGRLAEVVVLDQFSRNLYRNSPRAYAQDSQALVLAQEAIRVGADKPLDAKQRGFLYMPFMHSESRTIHEWALALFSQPGQAKHLSHERKHKAIIDRFGRYPHRNEVLGRTSTPEEKAFLEQRGSSF